MNAWIAVGAVNAWFFSVLVARKSPLIAADRVLAGLLASLGAIFAVVFVAREWAVDGLLLFLPYMNLFLGPLLLSYVAAMVNPAGEAPRSAPRWFLPFAIAMVYLSWLVLTRSDAELTAIFAERDFRRRSAVFNGFYLVDLISFPACLLASWIHLNRHRRRIAECYSDLTSIDYAWLRRLILALGILWAVIDLPLLGILFTDRMTGDTVLGLGFSLGTVLILYLAYFGIRQTAVYATTDPSIAIASPPESRYLHAGLDEEELGECRQKLLDHMEEHQPHLDRSLTLRELAGSVGLSEHNLSQVINVGLNQTFYEFVNGYRVKEFQRRATPEAVARHTLLDLAMNCGFNSKSSFNRIFKQQTGTTPSAWVKSRRAAP